LALPFEVPTLGVVAYGVVAWTQKKKGGDQHSRDQRARSGGLWSGGLDPKNGLKSGVGICYRKFNIWKWLKKKNADGMYCQVKNKEWKFDIWRWPKRKKKRVKVGHGYVGHGWHPSFFGSKPPLHRSPLRVLEPRKVGLALIPIDTNLSHTRLVSVHKSKCRTHSKS
ncbi:hypothetical protein Tco_0556021, partial [Tanacetum coccineum]